MARAAKKKLEKRRKFASATNAADAAASAIWRHIFSNCKEWATKWMNDASNGEGCRQNGVHYDFEYDDEHS